MLAITARSQSTNGEFRPTYQYRPITMDGKDDRAGFRPSEGNWYVFRSSLTISQGLVFQHRLLGDIPQPADYNGYRRVGYSVFRPSNNTWYVNRSTAGIFTQTFGQTGDIPASAPNPNTNQ